MEHTKKFTIKYILPRNIANGDKYGKRKSRNGTLDY